MLNSEFKCAKRIVCKSKRNREIIAWGWRTFLWLFHLLPRLSRVFVHTSFAFPSADIIKRSSSPLKRDDLGQNILSFQSNTDFSSQKTRKNNVRNIKIQKYIGKTLSIITPWQVCGQYKSHKKSVKHFWNCEAVVSGQEEEQHNALQSLVFLTSTLQRLTSKSSEMVDIIK